MVNVLHATKHEFLSPVSSPQCKIDPDEVELDTTGLLVLDFPVALPPPAFFCTCPQDPLHSGCTIETVGLLNTALNIKPFIS